MPSKKTTAQELIDGITGGTAKMFKDTETELYKQRLKLEALLKKSPIEGIFAGIERDVKAASEAAKTISDPKKFKANIFNRLWQSLQIEVPKFIKRTTKAFDPIIKPVLKATKDLEKGLSKTIVKPLTTVITNGSKALLKGVSALLKPIDKLIRVTIGIPLSKSTAFLTRIQKPALKFFVEVMPNLSSLVTKLLPLVKTFVKILPLIGLLLDILTGQSITSAINAQSRQLTQLNGMFSNLQVKVGEQARLLNRISAQLGSGGNVTATLSAEDLQAIVNAVVFQLKPTISNQKVDLSGVNSQLSKISSQVAGVQSPKIDLSPVTAQLTQISTQINRLPNPQEAISAAALSVAVVSAISPLIQQSKTDLNPVLSGIKQTNAGITTLNANVAQVNQRLNSPLTAIDPEVRATTTRIERQALNNGPGSKLVCV